MSALPGRRHAIPLLLALGACAARPGIEAPPAGAARAAGADWSRAETVTVALDEYGFRPAELRLPAGRPVRLRFVNEGGRPHDFTSPGLFRAAALRPGDPLAAEVLASGGSVDVPPGESRELALLAPEPGTHEVECRRPLHAFLGMTGRVVVAP